MSARVWPVIVAAAVVIGCSAPDRSFTHGVRDDDALHTAVLQAVALGSDSSIARQRMMQNGFDCVLRTGTSVDSIETDTAGPPPPRLTCIKDESARPETSDGKRRHFVNLLLSGSTVAAVEARSRIERVP
ncbi:MAG: hypothetical protein ABJE47_16285 [bacterium]